jgi:hypothetical protein
VAGGGREIGGRDRLPNAGISPALAGEWRYDFIVRYRPLAVLPLPLARPPAPPTDTLPPTPFHRRSLPPALLLANCQRAAVIIVRVRVRVYSSLLLPF